MSSAINHKKRSRYSYHNTGAAFRASSRQAYYREAYSPKRGLFSGLAAMLHRKKPQQKKVVRNAAEG